MGDELYILKKMFLALIFQFFSLIPALAADTQAPSVPTGVNASAMSGTQVGLSWISSTDDVGVAGYRIYRNGAQVGTALRNSYLDSGLTPSTFYQYQVAAYDVAGNVSEKSQTASVATDAGSGDQVPPSKPAGLTATANSSSQISLSWQASTDNVAVVGYKIYRGGVQIATSSGTSFQNTGLAAGTTYSYTVAAYDAAGNTSLQSSAASATTVAAPTTTTTTLPPTTTTKPPTTTTTTLPPTTTTKPPTTTTTTLPPTTTTKPPTTTTTLPPTTTTKPPTTTTTTLPPTTTTKPPTTTTTLPPTTTTKPPTTTTTLPPTTTTKPPTTTTTSTTTTTTTTLPAHLVELVQNAYAVPQAARKSVAVPFFYKQNSGNMNIIAVGFSDVAASIQSVTDSQGNSYQPATSLLRSTAHSQRIYFAKNIKAGSNTVTVAFDRNANFPDIRIAEYSGIDTSFPLSNVKFATGKSSSIVVSGISTIKPSELLFAAGMTSAQFTNSGNGFSFVAQTNPNGNMTAERKVLASGIYEFTATQSGPGDWLVQVIGFKAGGQ